MVHKSHALRTSSFASYFSCLLVLMCSTGTSSTLQNGVQKPFHRKSYLKYWFSTEIAEVYSMYFTEVVEVCRYLFYGRAILSFESENVHYSTFTTVR